MTIRHVGQPQSGGGVFPERAGDECQAAEDDYGEQHGRSAASSLAPIPGMVEVLLGAAPMMESIEVILFVGGADVVAWRGIKVVDGVEIGVGKGVESVISRSRERTQ